MMRLVAANNLNFFAPLGGRSSTEEDSLAKVSASSDSVAAGQRPSNSGTSMSKRGSSAPGALPSSQ